MLDNSLGVKIDGLLEDLRMYIETNSLSDNEIYILKDEIDRLIYECMYYKSKLAF